MTGFLTLLASSAVYAPSFFWMWNAPIDTDVYCRQIDEMADNGVRSICIHPVPRNFRPGVFPTEMAPDYLTDEYLRRYETIVRHASARGVHSYLYDEGGWPSGGACGLVMKADAEGRFRHRGLMPKVDGGYEEVVKPYGPGGANYPSPLEKGMVESFIALTHERIKGVLGDEFGKAIQVAFMDEPGFTTWYRQGGIPWCSDFAEEFRRRKGYDLTPFLPELVRWRNESKGELLARWLDYREVVGDLFIDRFIAPIRNWCRANGLQSGGHLSGEHNPERFFCSNFGNVLKCMRAMDAPGVDVIWRQLHPETWPADKIVATFPRYATSAAHYNGSDKVICELGAIYGNSLTPAELKWLTNYCLVRGNNLFVFAYRAVDNSGAWQLLFEPHVGPVNPQWPFQKPFYEGLGRLSEELAKGRSAVETVVFFDQRSFSAGAAAATIAANAHQTCARALDERHCDYDFADDEVFENATVGNGTLTCGAMTYTTVVVPARGLMTEKAARVIANFKASGGRVLGLAELDEVKPVCRVEGVLSGDIRATKRFVEDKTYFFLVNETVDESNDLVIDLGVRGPLVVMDPVTGVKREIRHENGRFRWRFGKAGSALFIAGETAETQARILAPPKSGAGMRLEAGWTLQAESRCISERDDLVVKPLVSEPVKLDRLGDWRDLLGQFFSGTVTYVNRFASEGGNRILDLGKVAFACSVRLNGIELKPTYAGPFRWEVELRDGVNVLEVTVANQMSVMMSDELLRNAIRAKYPINGEYEARMRVYDHSNSDSGLYGPVVIY